MTTVIKKIQERGGIDIEQQGRDTENGEWAAWIGWREGETVCSFELESMETDEITEESRGLLFVTKSRPMVNGQRVLPEVLRREIGRLGDLLA